MPAPPRFLPSRAAVSARYRVELLHEARAAANGLRHLENGCERELAWSAVAHVWAAEVGEPEGVCTIVFDLVVGRGPEGLAVRRFDAEPGEPATELARVLLRHLPPERLAAPVKSLAVDGRPNEWHPDLESFEEAALAALLDG
jgi:hypothetical protein